MKTIGVIPARFASTRFPAKVLAEIEGKPMVRHVWERASAARELDEVLIACDHEKVYNAAQGFKAKAVMTDPQLASGSDRIAAVVRDMAADIVVNIQGDEPFVDPAAIDAVVSLLKQDSTVMMGTAIKELTDDKDMASPHVVKCVVDRLGFALYFSRSPIPYHQSNTGATKNYKHLGLYAYRKSFLMQFTGWPKGALEAAESLEQLRALEGGIKIKTTVVKSDSIAVDTPQDLEKAKAWYGKLKSTTR